MTGPRARSEASRAAGGKSAKIPMRDFAHSLPMSLLRAREAAMRHFRPILRTHNITEQQWRILRALAASGGIEITALARTAFLLGPSLSRILRDLEERTLIDRRPLENDLRRSIVHLTEKGLKLIEAIAPNSEAIYLKMTKRFGTRKLAELQIMLHELEVSLLAMPAADETGDGHADIRDI